MLLRCADGTVSLEEAKRKNEEHFKRFHGRPKSPNMLF